MYHPAAAFRQGSLKQTMLEDMCNLPDALIASRQRRAARDRADRAAARPRVAEESDPAEPADELPPALDEPVALEVEPELVAVAVAADPFAAGEMDMFVEPIPVDENQMSLF